MRSHHARRSAYWVTLALALAACHRSSQNSGATPAPTKRYTVRALVVTLPAQSSDEVTLRHEAIPDFTDQSGAGVGMDSMEMPFPIAKGVSLAGLASGDKVEATFSVDWSQGRYAVESIKKLPPETPLELGKGRAMEAAEHEPTGDAAK